MSFAAQHPNVFVQISVRIVATARPLRIHTMLHCQPSLPVSSDVSHEQDAGIHVEEKGRESKVAEDQAGGQRFANIFSDADGKTEA